MNRSFGAPCEAATAADRVYAGFWTDKGCCDEKSREFLGSLRDTELFLFGTAGFCVDSTYFDKVLSRVKALLHPSVRCLGGYMCQGKMPPSVRERYEKIKESPSAPPTIDMMIGNFDMALSHPDEKDIQGLIDALKHL